MNRINEIIKSINFGSNSTSPFNDKQIFNSFKQGTVDLPLLRRLGGGGNCASVALIKAAIGTFGFDNIFNSIVIDDTNQRYIIDLKDDESTTYTLTFQNYEYGAEKSAFKVLSDDETSKDIFEFAKFCFAVMAEVKRSNYRINRGYSRAINDLNKGESAYYIHEYLGLNKVDLEDLSFENLSKHQNLIVWNDPHAVYSSHGYYDEFFEGFEGVQPLTKLQEIHGDGTPNDKPNGAQMLV